MRNKIFIIVIIIIISTAFSTLLFININNFSKNVILYNDNIVKKYSNYYETITYTYRINAETYYNETIANNKEIIDIIDKANNITDKESDYLRNRLIDILSPTYQRAVENNFRQFHFHLADCTSFLRFHKTELHGDNLKNIRETVRIANEEQRYCEGFEEGKVYNGYRYVFPLFKDGNHIGSVETSVSTYMVMELINELFDTTSSFIIKKSIVDGKVYEGQIHNYIDCDYLDSYYYDKEINNNFSSNNSSERLLLIEKINENIKKEVSELIQTEDDFIINTELESQNYLVLFLPIYNISNEQVAYFVFYENNHVLGVYKHVLLVNITLLVLVVILVIATIIFLNISKIKAENHSNIDRLTGLYNRKKFNELIEYEINRHDRYNIKFSIIMYDIDHFKKVNDDFGHVNGDIILSEMSALVKLNIRKSDFLVRWGGEEFIILLPHTSKNEATEIAEITRIKIESHKFSVNGLDKVTVSLGVAEYSNSESADDLISRVDNLLYFAKSSGRNQVRC